MGDSDQGTEGPENIKDPEEHDRERQTEDEILSRHGTGGGVPGGTAGDAGSGEGAGGNAGE